MKVYNLCCEQTHRFEGWFSSEDDFISQSDRLLIECPVCNSSSIKRLPSAPRLNLSSVHSQDTNAGNTHHEKWMEIAREVIAHTEDVGDRFAEEARRIHYREIPARGIRGVASPEEREALAEEGIEALAFPLPPILKQVLQ